MAVTNYLSIDGEVLMESKTSPSDRVMYVRDGLGSVMATADSQGNVLNTYMYKPSGAVWQKTGSAPDPRFLWCGTWGYRQSGNSWNSHYVRARHYSHNSGAWTTVDPLWPSEPGYGYVGGRAMGAVDPSGMQGSITIVAPPMPIQPEPPFTYPGWIPPSTYPGIPTPGQGPTAPPPPSPGYVPGDGNPIFLMLRGVKCLCDIATGNNSGEAPDLYDPEVRRISRELGIPIPEIAKRFCSGTPKSITVSDICDELAAQKNRVCPGNLKEGIARSCVAGNWPASRRDCEKWRRYLRDWKSCSKIREQEVDWGCISWENIIGHLQASDLAKNAAMNCLKVIIKKCY